MSKSGIQTTSWTQAKEHAVMYQAPASSICNRKITHSTIQHSSFVKTCLHHKIHRSNKNYF